MSPKLIDTKQGAEDVEYQLKRFEGDNQYVIYRLDRKKLEVSSEAQRIPEVGVFNTEKEAREALKGLE